MPYSYTLPLTIDHTKVAGELTHFPVLISATIATLKTAANGGHVQNSSGYDIQFFADSALFNPLTYEVESWDATTGAIVAWVRIPALSALADTVIYLAYGDSSITTSRANASGVWAGYRAVYHFGSASSLSLADSTGNANTLSNHSTAIASTGKVGGAVSLNGTTQYLTATSAASLNFGAEDLSYSLWLKSSGSSLSTTAVLVSKRSSGDIGYHSRIGSSSDSNPDKAISFLGDSGGLTEDQDFSTDVVDTQWHHLVFQRSGTLVKIFVDGVQVVSATTTRTGSLSNSQDLTIGRFPTSGIQFWPGQLDEVRIYAGAISASWIATEYANQNSPSTFVTVGSESSFTSSVSSAIASVLVGGFEFVTQTLVRGFEITDSINDRLGTCKMSIFGSPADLNTWLIPGATVEVWGGSSTAGSGGGGEFGAMEFGGTTFGGGVSSLSRIFYGRVISVAPIGHTVGASGTGYTEFVLTCRNFGDLLDSTIITTAITYTSELDSDIIADLFSTYLTEISTSAVDSVGTVATITFDNISLRQAMEQICNLTGAQFYVDTQKVLQYHSPSATAAPFGISDTPDNVTTFNPLYQPTYLLDFSNGANRVKVIGALGSGGTPLTSTRNDTTSQGLYGIKSRVIVDRNITTSGQADARGDIELARYATPIQSGTFATYLDGLAIGQLIPVTLNSLNVSGSFLISKVTRTYPSTTDCKYVVEFGPYQPDLARALRKALTEAPQPPQTPYAIPAPLSVVPGSFASSIQKVLLVNSLPTLPDATYPPGILVENTGDRLLYRNVSDAWVKVVRAIDLDGQITTTQITDSSISTAKIQALAIDASLIAANAITAGKIAADAVIAGTIAAGAIRASDAAFDTGAIQTADIGNLQVTAAKIANATITAAQIANATITNALIVNATITGAKIANATITNALINDLSASKLTAGTIDASVITVSNINASNITTGSLSATRISAGSISLGGGSLDVTNGSMQLAGTVFSVAFSLAIKFSVNSTDIVANNPIDCSDSINADSYTVSGTTVINSSRNINAASTYSVASTQVVGTRKGGWTQPSGTATRSGYTTSTATAQDVAEALKALIADLASHGLIGA